MVSHTDKRILKMARKNPEMTAEQIARKIGRPNDVERVEKALRHLERVDAVDLALAREAMGEETVPWDEVKAKLGREDQMIHCNMCRKMTRHMDLGLPGLVRFKCFYCGEYNAPVEEIETK
jgi:tRNA-dihydrouridine synthase